MPPPPPLPPLRVALTAADRELIAAYLRRPTIAEPKTAPSVFAQGPASRAEPASSSRQQAPPLLPKRPASTSRDQLPAFIHREQVLETVRSHSVTLLRGATGCGKSTQLPQLLLEEAARRGEPCCIIVAQPRRLAATALAERVAAELGEQSVGGLVGYQIRGESRVGPNTALTFVTTGDGQARVGPGRRTHHSAHLRRHR